MENSSKELAEKFLSDDKGEKKFKLTAYPPPTNTYLTMKAERLYLKDTYLERNNNHHMCIDYF